jgi:hypothetical protein
MLKFFLIFPQVIAEIELFYMLPHQRRKNDWFPEVMYVKF